MYLSAVTKTNVGKKRDHNEDFVTKFEPTEKQDIKNSGSLFIVADGVGGASQGERASQYAAEMVLYEYYNAPEISPQARLQQIIQSAGNQINRYAEEGERFMRMATTMVAAVILDDTLIVANVGDSRAYLIRDNVANQITKDHSFVGEMVRDGLMTEEEARTSKQKNRITRSLGGERDVRVDIFDGIKLADGDKILLCSDGFSQYATRETIATLVQNGTAEEITNRMIEHANQHGGSDNISVILIKVSASPLDETLAMGMAKQPVRTQPVWNNLDTDHGGEEKETEDGFFFGLGKKNAAILGSAGILFACFVFAVFFRVLWQPKPGSPPTSPPGADAYVATGTANASNSISTAESIGMTQTALATTPMLTITPLPTFTLPPTLEQTPLSSTVVPLPTSLPAEGAFCRYTFTTQDQDKEKFPDLPTFLEKRFSIPSQGNQNFTDNIAPYIKCADLENNASCEYDEWYAKREGYYVIPPSGWTIEFPLQQLGVTPDSCKGPKNDGKVIDPSADL